MDFLVRARGLVSPEILSQAKQLLCNGSLWTPTNALLPFVESGPALDSNKPSSCCVTVSNSMHCRSPWALRRYSSRGTITSCSPFRNKELGLAVDWKRTTAVCPSRYLAGLLFHGYFSRFRKCGQTAGIAADSKILARPGKGAPCPGI